MANKTPLKTRYLRAFSTDIAKIAKKGCSLEPDKPCPWHADTLSRTGAIGAIYCEVGAEGHLGAHLGERSQREYLRRLHIWRVFKRNQYRKELNGSSE